MRPSAAVVAVLNAATADGRTLVLPRDVSEDAYRETRAVLLAAGGQRVRGGFQFPGQDPAVVVRGITGCPGPEEEENFPAGVAGRILGLAGPLEGVTVLVPDAGSGVLSSAAARAGAVVDCTDASPAACRLLDGTGLYRDVRRGSFLRLNPDGTRYGAILMAPPIRQDTGARCVLNGLPWLDGGGVLVAVLPAAALHRADAASRQVRSVAGIWNGTVEDVAPGTFRTAGYSGGTCLLALRKPGRRGETPARTVPAPAVGGYQQGALFA